MKNNNIGLLIIKKNINNMAVKKKKFFHLKILKRS